MNCIGTIDQTNDDDLRQCKPCGHWFEPVNFVWKNEWLTGQCPNCGIELATQTKWFELRPYSQIGEKPE